MVLKTVELGKEKILRDFCDCVCVKNNDSVQSATWNGLQWWGDIL